MRMIAGLFGLAAAAAFAGAAFYVNVAEQPARLRLDDEALLANWPFTLLVMMPTNKRLNAWPAGSAGPGSRALIGSWGKFHAVRTALGLAAAAVYLGLAANLSG